MAFRNLLLKRAFQGILMYSQVGETTALASLCFSFFSFSSLCYVVGKYCDVGLGWPFGARRVRGGREGERQAHAILGLAKETAESLVLTLIKELHSTRCSLFFC